MLQNRTARHEIVQVLIKTRCLSHENDKNSNQCPQTHMLERNDHEIFGFL